MTVFGRKRKIILLLLAGLILRKPAVSEVNSWTNINPGLRTVNALAFDPQTSSVLYAGGSGGVFKSVDGGLTWRPTGPGLACQAVLALAFDSAIPANLYAGTTNGVFRSSEKGATWTGTAVWSDGIGAISFDPKSASIIYAEKNGEVYKSTNGGATWALVKSGLTNEDLHIRIDPQNTSTIYILYVDGLSSFIIKSTDSGATWGSLPAPAAHEVFAGLVIDPRSPSTLFTADLNGGVYKSGDGGNTWTNVYRFGDAHIWGLNIDPHTSALYLNTTGGIVFGQSEPHPYLYRSSDGGVTWKLVSSADTTPSLVFDPKSSTTAVIGGYLTIFKSLDGGTTWSGKSYGLNAAIRSIGISSQSPTVLYAGGDAPTGEGHLYKTADGGSNWQPLTTGLPDASVDAVAIDPATEGTAFAFQGSGLYKTANGGQSWSFLVYVGSSQKTSLIIHPAAPSTLYAGGSDGVFKSTDGGATWMAVNSGFPTSKIIQCLAAHPANPAIVYAGTWGQGVFKTTNGGGAWTAVNTGIGSHSYVYAVVLDPLTPETAYAAAGSSGVFKSTNGGGTWTAVNAGLLLPAIDCRALALDPNHPETIYVGGNASAAGANILYKSADSGAAWSPASAGLAGNDISKIAVDTSPSAQVYAGTSANGLFKSADGGASWSRASVGLKRSIADISISRQTPSVLWVGIGSGGNSFCEASLYKSLDEGKVWFLVNEGLMFERIHAVLVDPKTAATLYIAGELGIFKSTDGGTSWKAVNSGLVDKGGGLCGIHCLAVDPETPATLYAGCYYSGSGGSFIFKSIDGGTSWSPINNGIAGTTLTVKSLAVNPQTTSTLFAATSAGMYKTTDGGGQWTICDGLGLKTVNAVGIDPRTPATLYAGTEKDGIYKSTDDGSGWAQANTGIQQNEYWGTIIRALTIDAQNPSILFCGTRFNGIYKSKDGAANWTAENTGFSNEDLPETWELAQDPRATKKVYAATSSGLFSIFSTDTVFSLTVQSSPPKVTGIYADPYDLNFSRGGTTEFVLSFYERTSVSLKAPDLFNGGAFQKWTIDGADSANRTIQVTMDKAHTALAVYAAEAVPAIALSRTKFNFGADTGGLVTRPQTFIVSNGGSGTLAWSVTDDASWVACAPTSGTNIGVVTITVDPSLAPEGASASTISVAAAGALNSPQTVSVRLVKRVPAAGTPPFGSFDTPLEGTTGISGAIPVTGWVVDDIETTGVRIWRDPVAGEGAGLVFIGDAIFVEGARTDVEQEYPNHPLNYQAGWGYMLLTNFLPAQGNGTYKLYAIATDKEGNTLQLGPKTITCDNAHAVKPFGTIDTPGQGGTASGNKYVNFGWVMTPLPGTVPKDGHLITVYVDSVLRGNLSTPPNLYNAYRPDVSTNFPGLNNTGGPGAGEGGPIGAFFLDTTGYANGVHSIFWIAYDDLGRGEGIGSRYFNILNTASPASRAEMEAGPPVEPRTAAASAGEFIGNLPLSLAPLSVKTGLDPNAVPAWIDPDRLGVYPLEIRELERLEIHLGKGEEIAGFQHVGNELRPLPIGSTLDLEHGVFAWLPGPGFLGKHDLVFIVGTKPEGFRKIRVSIDIKPKYSFKERSSSDD